MNKEMQKLLRQINDKKNEVKSLVADGKLDKARTAKEELKTLQEKFDLLFDLDEEEHEEIEDKVGKGTAKVIGGEKADKKNLVKSFVNIVKAGFLHVEPDEADVKEFYAEYKGTEFKIYSASPMVSDNRRVLLKCRAGA